MHDQEGQTTKGSTMATWFQIIFTGEPTEADFARVAELAAQGMTAGQLLNDDGEYSEEQNAEIPEKVADMGITQEQWAEKSLVQRRQCIAAADERDADDNALMAEQYPGAAG
jgi:hypothetical protein